MIYWRNYAEQKPLRRRGISQGQRLVGMRTVWNRHRLF
jgi:hypothetical protein